MTKQQISTNYRGHCTYCGARVIIYNGEPSCECYCRYNAPGQTPAHSDQRRYIDLAKVQRVMIEGVVRRWKEQQHALLISRTEAKIIKIGERLGIPDDVIDKAVEMHDWAVRRGTNPVASCKDIVDMMRDYRHDMRDDSYNRPIKPSGWK